MNLIKILVILGVILVVGCDIALATMTVYNVEDDVLYSDNILFIKADDSGSIWIGQAIYGLIKFHKRTTWINYRSPSSGIMNDWITDISFDSFDNYENDSAGGIWISTQTGLSRFDGAFMWDTLNNDDSLYYSNFSNVAIDKDDMVWLGTFNAGLVRYNRDTAFVEDTTFLYYSKDDGLLDNRVTSLFVDKDNNIWSGGYYGLSRFDNDSGWITYTSANSGLLDDTINDIAQDLAGNMWFATSTGLNKLSPDSTWTAFYEGHNCPYPLGKVIAITNDSSGNIWIGSDMKERNNVQIAKFNGITYWEIANIDNNPAIEFVKVTDIAVDNDGEIWVSTDGEGVTRIAGNLTAISDEICSLIPSEYSLSQNYPNPFNLSTTIEYTLPERTELSISIYNIVGQKIAELYKGVQPAGVHSTIWNGTNLTGNVVSTGIYFYQIQSEDFSDIKKMVLLK